MNKRFSTLMACALLCGGLFCNNAYADVTGATPEIADAILKDGTKYYFADATTPTKFVVATVIAASDDPAFKVLTLGTPVSAGSVTDASILEIDETTVGGAVYIKLKATAKDGDGKNFSGVVYVNADGTAIVSAKKDLMEAAMKTALSEFKLSGSKYVDAGLAINTAGTNFISAGAAGIATTENIIFMRPSNDVKTVAQLNAVLGGSAGFGLQFPTTNPVVANNPFAGRNIQAITYDNKTYLKTNGAVADAAIVTPKEFAAAEFIALDTIPLTQDGSSDFGGKKGAGYQFKIVKGSDMLVLDGAAAAIDQAARKRNLDNAQFTISNNINNPDSLIIELAAPKFGFDTKKAVKDHVLVGAYNSTSDNKVRVSIVNFAGQNYVTTYNDGVTNKVVPTRWSLVKFGASNLVAQKDLLGIYNIKSLNYATKGKVFGPETDDNTEAVDAKLVQLTKPEGQFVVTSTMDASGAITFKFRNRESHNDYTATGLRKLADGNYTQTNGDTIMIVAAVSTDGYKNYSQKLQLDKTAYNIAVYSAVTDNVYLTEKHSAGHFVGLNTDVKEAANWRLVKFEEGAVTGDNAHAQDSIFLTTDVAYLKADGKYATDKKDTVTIFSYAIYNEATKEFLSYDANKKAFFCDPTTKDLNVRDAKIARFIIKEKGDNKYNLVVVGDGNTSTAYNAAITSIDGLDKLYGAFSDNKVNQNETGLYELTDNDLFVIEEVAAPFYRPVATFDTISIYKEGNEKIALYERNNFLGMQHMADVPKMAAAMFVDTAFVRGNTNKPQYLLAVEHSFRYHNADCDIPDHPAIPSLDVDTVYGRFLVNMVDSAYAYGFDKHDNPYVWENNQSYKLAFMKAFHTNDTLFIQRANNVVGDSIWVGKDNNEAIGKYAFRYVDRSAKSFIIETAYNGTGKTGYIKWLNGTPAVVDNITQAEVFNMNEDEKGIPTDNETIGTTEVSVIAGNGQVVINNAAGKSVVISNILGQAIVKAVLSSDNATISVPAGIVVVAVEGEAAVKAIIK